MIEITEVGLRDGLQNESEPFSTDQKIELAGLLLAAGVRRLEATAFVSPKAVPQMADAEEVVEGIKNREDIIIEALVPNARGGERAASVGVDVWVAFMSASEKHSLANSNVSVEEAFARIRPLPDLAHAAGASVAGAIAVAFDCPFEGGTPVDQIVKIAKWFDGIGITTLKLGDTIGTASPKRVRRLVEALRAELPDLELVLHFHNTRGMGLANILAGIDCGVTRFESSIGGIGGCPFAPGATGNVPTEDVVHLLHLEDHNTGLDLDALVHAGEFVQSVLGRPLPAHLQSASPVGVLHDFDEAIRAKG